MKTNNNQLTEEQLEHLYQNVLAPLGVTRGEWQQILESGILTDLVESIRRRGYLVRGDVRPALGLEKWPEPTHFSVTVRLNRQLTLRQSAALTGCETQPAESIPDRSFTGAHEEDVNLTIFHFGKGRQMSHKEVLAELTAYGYRPVLVEEILALSAQKPNLQTKFPIAGVGCNEGDRYFWMIDCPVVRSGPKKRRVGGTFNRNETLYDFYRVVAVRDPNIVPTKSLGYSKTTEDQEVRFADSEYRAMRSVYLPTAAA